MILAPAGSRIDRRRPVTVNVPRARPTNVITNKDGPRDAIAPSQDWRYFAKMPKTTDYGSS
jgi:hypothetical protein